MAQDSVIKKRRFKKILKITSYIFLGVIALLLVAGGLLSIYFNNHKSEIVADINQKINENIKGNVAIGDIGYTLIKGFPNFAMTIDNVVVKDSLWKQHKHTLLNSKEIEVHLNLKRLLFNNEVAIEKIKINDAKIDLFVDKNGVSNSDIFKPKPKETVSKPKKELFINTIDLENVEFISENIQRDKLFNFKVYTLKSKSELTNTGFKSNLYINTLANSMAFKLSKGSFIKDKVVKGNLSLDFNKAEKKISVNTQKLGIGDDTFDIIAHFSLDKNNPLFDLDINTEILWGNASRLLSANILKTLKKFDMKKPIKVNCTIAGDMSVEGDPNINVKAIIKDNEVKTPNGTITNCTFNGEYINEFKKGDGTSDENSAVILTNFKGDFYEIPISIPKGTIKNFTTPTATGVFKSNFKVNKLNQFINDDLMAFSEGNANVYLKFNADLVDLKINKPMFSGNLIIKNTTLKYIPKDLIFTQTNIALNFTEEALTIDQIKFVSKNNVNTISMKGKIDNFLDLYYNDPGKMVVNWDIYSPNFNAQGFLTMLATKSKTATATKTPTNKTSKKIVSGNLQKMIDECQVNINIKADKMTYNRLIGTNYTTSIQLKNGELFVNNGSVYTCNGHVTFNAQLIPKNDLYDFYGEAKITTVDISRFLTAFNNFGITSFQSSDIKGNLNLDSYIKGSITQTGDLVENSVSGNVNYEIAEGQLIDFDPIVKIGKAAFPNRDVKNIAFEGLKGDFKINKELITVDLIKFSSNVLNFDVGGVYSLGKGTDLKMTIPLRDPKNDYLITNSVQREKERYKGVIINLQIVDGADGKIAIKLNPQNVERTRLFK